MPNNFCVTGANDVLLKEDIIKIVQNRFEMVKNKKAQRIKDWKDSLIKLTKDAKNKVKNYNKQIEELDDQIKKNINVQQNTKKIEQLKKSINKLENNKYTDKDLKQAQLKICQDIMDEIEGHVCPFCGKSFGSVEGVKSHLNEKGEGLSDEEIKEMNTMPQRSENYAQKYKKVNGTQKFDVEVKLNNFQSGQLIKVDVSEEIHHLISVDPYASTLRVSRIGNLMKFNINDNSNLISAPCVDANAFKKNYNKAYSSLDENDKQIIAEKIIETKQIQVHQGGHGFKPAKGVKSYEKQLVQDMSVIEAEVLEMSKKDCLGQTKNGRNDVAQYVKKKLEDLQGDIKGEITNFKKSSKLGSAERERFLAQYDYDFHIGKPIQRPVQNLTGNPAKRPAQNLTGNPAKRCKL